MRYSTALPGYYFGPEPRLPSDRPGATPRRALASILTSSDVLLDVDAPTKGRALHEIARFVAGRHGLIEVNVYTSLVERERIGSTGLGFGIAIPHARVQGLLLPVAAFVRTKTPIEFGAPDDKPVSEMLVLLVPPQATDEHLQLLAEIAEMFSDRKLRDSLHTRVDAAAVHALLAAGEAP
jgi:PTS system nitrogen regulatory IIA component